MLGLGVARTGYSGNLGSLLGRRIPVFDGDAITLTARDVRALETISPQRVNHILFGEGRGKGGHLEGYGLPSKPKFSGWTPTKILDAGFEVLRNPGTKWVLQKNGRYRLEGIVDGIRVDVIVELRGDSPSIITVYPVK